MTISTDVSAGMQADPEQQRLNRAYAVLSHCSHALARSVEERDLLGSFCTHLVEQGGYAFAWIGYAAEDNGCRVRMMAHAGREHADFTATALAGVNAEHRPSPCRTAVRTGRPVVLREIPSAAARAPWADAARRFGFRSLIALPLKTDDKTFGNFSIFATQAEAFSDREVGLLEQLAEDLAFGIESLRERALRVRRLREIAEKDERERIAASLHDVVGQTVLTVNLGLKRVRAMLESHPRHAIKELLEQVIAQTATAIHELRTISGELRPLFLDHLSLGDAIRYHCKDMGARAGLSIRVTPDDDDFTVEQRVKEQCFLGFREAVTNTIKYAEASRLNVSLSGSRQYGLIVTIADDGVGFDPQSLRCPAGLGLCMIRERAESAGGYAEIRSTPGAGTTVTITVPLGTADHDTIDRSGVIARLSNSNNDPR